MSATSPLSVLMVEDDEQLAHMYARQFEMAGIPYILAKNGEQALSALKIALPNIILLDISLPDIDGFEVLKRIKADKRVAHIPVIIMSNFSRPEDIEWGKSLGAEKFVEKVSLVPAEVADLVRREAKTDI